MECVIPMLVLCHPSFGNNPISPPKGNSQHLFLLKVEVAGKTETSTGNQAAVAAYKLGKYEDSSSHLSDVLSAQLSPA